MDGWQVVVFTVALMLIGIDDMQVKCFVMQSGMDILFKIGVLSTKWSMSVAPFYDTPFFCERRLSEQFGNVFVISQ